MAHPSNRSVYAETRITGAARMPGGHVFLGIITPLCISMISGVCVQDMWNAHVKGQVTETHRLKANSHCDTALFISMYDITMVQP